MVTMAEEVELDDVADGRGAGGTGTDGIDADGRGADGQSADGHDTDGSGADGHGASESSVSSRPEVVLDAASPRALPFIVEGLHSPFLPALCPRLSR